jgi:hypothetical protein
MSEDTPCPITPFVPVPTAYLDAWMPRLRDTELRVLLVVCRQTRGRRERQPNGRSVARCRDWLSHSQLVRRTGRGSEAVSAAIQNLVERGLVVVESAAGQALTTSGERRRHLGNLYYRLGDTVPVENVVKVGKTPPSFHPGKPKTTKDRRNENKHILSPLPHSRGYLLTARPGEWWATAAPNQPGTGQDER